MTSIAICTSKTDTPSVFPESGENEQASAGITLSELKSALLRVGCAHPDASDVMRAACAILEELTTMRSEMKVRAIAGRAQLSQGNTPEAMRMFDSVEKIAGAPGRRFHVTHVGM